MPRGGSGTFRGVASTRGGKGGGGAELRSEDLGEADERFSTLICRGSVSMRPSRMLMRRCASAEVLSRSGSVDIL